MRLVPEKKAVVLTVRNPNRITTLIPRHQQLDEHVVAVRHGTEEAMILRNIGIEVPAPVLSYYDWPGQYTPFQHQRKTTAFCTMYKRCFVFNGMGTGKSMSALWAADWLMREGLVRKVLILSTMTCMVPVWQQELFSNLMHRTSIVVHGTRAKRTKMIREDVDFYIINHDGIRLPGIVDEFLARGDIDLIIVDEASALRNSRTQTYQAMKKLLRPQHRLWMLTGQPCPNGPEDAFGLGQLVSPHLLPPYITRWQAETMLKINEFKWVPKPGAMQRVYEVLQPAIRYGKEDCLDLPPVVYLNRQAELSPEQDKAYRTMREHLRITHNGEPVTAVNAAVKLGKLLQLCCGSVHTDVDTYAALDTGPRLAALKEAVIEASAKVIVFVPYTGALRQVCAYLEGEGFSVGMVDGSVTGGARDRVLHAFTREKEPMILVANPKTAAHGLNLTVADTSIWFSPIHSLDVYRQACERMARPGQTKHMRIVHLGSTKLEWGVYQVLRGKDAAQQSLLELYKQEMES